MDLKKIEQLIKLAKASDIAELEVAEGEDKLRITLNKPHQIVAANLANMPAQHLSYPGGDVAMQIAPTQNSSAASASSEQSAKSGSSDLQAKHVITSPMVGTFYSASSPSAKPFVEVGQKVKAKQVLCIIEAMKLMNQIEADQDGVIKEILAKDGDPIEFAQALFVLE